MFKLEFETDNDSFKDGMAVAEILFILTRLHSSLIAGDTSGRVYDSNGNTVGKWELSE